jgi:hypothetical protein
MAAEPRVGADVKAAAAVAAALSLLCILLENTYVGLALCLIIIPALIYAAARSPLRYSLYAMMFFALVLPNTQEGIPSYEWLPPFIALGKVLLNHLNTFDHDSGVFSALPFSGFDVALVVLAVIHFIRKSSGSRLDKAGQMPTPEPMIKLAWLSLGSIGLVCILGLLTGGNFGMALWQLNAVMYTPLFFLLFQAGLRGPSDARPIAKVILLAAAYKSVLAYYVINNVFGPKDPWTGLLEKLPYATAHADSILFADACLVMIALLLERQKVKAWAAFLLPLFAIGMVSNNRRLVWVQVVAVLFTVFIISKDNPVKRMLRKAVIFGAPVVLVYVILGWNSGGGMTFKPVRMLRSVVDAKSDGSSFWRELENFNLITTLRQNPIFGLGYGHPYQEFVAMPAVDYPLEHYVPHNGILGLWAFSGLIGFAGLAMLWAGGVYYAMRAYHGAKSGQDRAAALVCYGAVLVWLMSAWGDLGLGVWPGVFTIAPALAMGSKLAAANGEWSDKKKVKARAA